VYTKTDVSWSKIGFCRTTKTKVSDNILASVFSLEMQGHPLFYLSRADLIHGGRCQRAQLETIH